VFFLIIFIVFVVLKDVRKFVFLSNFVMILVSFPMYVKVAHFCLFVDGVYPSIWFRLFPSLFVPRIVIVV
jgi:hypothetical protein